MARKRSASANNKRKASRSRSSSSSSAASKGHAVTPYLTIAGASEAIKFYRNAFGARELGKTALPDGKILHARIKIGGSMIMLSDEFPGSPHKSPSSIGTSTVTLHIHAKNVDKLWQQAISAGAKVMMPLDNQFWGERYGQLADPFGHHWSLSQPVKMSRKEMEEKRSAVMSMFSQGQHLSHAEVTTASAVNQ